MMRSYFITFLTLLTVLCYGQNDSTKKITYGAYGELHYNYDFSNPGNHEIPNFLYNHKRYIELNANLLLLKANYSDKKNRANIGFMAGNYSQYNLSAELTWAQFIYEVNIGLKSSNKTNIWIDAGILPSHIGFESAISADC